MMGAAKVFVFHAGDLATDADEAYIQRFNYCLRGRQYRGDSLFHVLILSIPAQWNVTYDVVNPYGDARTAGIQSVWLFDLDRDMLFLTKWDAAERESRYFSVPLDQIRQHGLTLNDCQPLPPPPAPTDPTSDLPAPYWEGIPETSHLVRERSFIGRLLSDFSYVWRHLFRRHGQLNHTTFLRLAYATVWIVTLEFAIVKRIGGQNMVGDPRSICEYVSVMDLPAWSSPEDTIVTAGRGVKFVLAQTTAAGLDLIRGDLGEGREETAAAAEEEEDPSDDVETDLYILLTLRHAVLVRRAAIDGSLQWTKPEPLFHHSEENSARSTPSSRAIDYLLLATPTAASSCSQPLPKTRIHMLPTEIQNHILQFTSPSAVAAAKRGCQFGLGLPFSWRQGGAELSLMERRTGPYGSGPVESQIRFGNFMSGVSYKPRGVVTPRTQQA